MSAARGTGEMFLIFSAMVEVLRSGSWVMESLLSSSLKLMPAKACGVQSATAWAAATSTALVVGAMIFQPPAAALSPPGGSSLAHPALNAAETMTCKDGVERCQVKEWV